MKKLTAVTCVSVALTVCGAIVAPASAQTVTGPYELKVFANAPSGLSAPDSIAVLRGHVFVGYGDGHLPDGSDGLNSQVVEFSKDGAVLHTYTVPGHNDGLKVNPRTHELWAIQNEDANANLVIINAETHDQKLYTFGPTLHGGGYDDLVFIGHNVYVSASNPAKNPNTGPAIVSVKLVGNTVQAEPVLAGTASAIDIPTDAVTQLNLQDPDSMTVDPEGDIVLDSQGDDELIIVTNPGSSAQQVSHLPLTQRTAAGLVPIEVDDTAFTTSTEGVILFADKGLNKVFSLKKKSFAPGEAYTAADGGPFVGTIDLTTGIITPVVTGLGNPGGMVFVDTSRQDADDDCHGDNDCRDHN